MLQRIDPLRLARLERARQHAERQLRLGYPDAKARLKRIAAAQERVLNGAPTTKSEKTGEVAPPEIAIEQVEQACQKVSHSRTWRWWK